MKCPRCNSLLASAKHDEAQIEVCPKCKGEWLHPAELQNIVQHHDEIFSPEELASLDAVNKQVLTAEKDDDDELNCARCEGIRMEHFNYADTSGIILHKCPACGGIWTDKDQLTKVKEVVDGWKAYLGQDMTKYGPILQKIEMEEEKQLDQSVFISRFGFVNSVLRRVCE